MRAALSRGTEAQYETPDPGPKEKPAKAQAGPVHVFFNIAHIVES